MPTTWWYNTPTWASQTATSTTSVYATSSSSWWSGLVGTSQVWGNTATATASSLADQYQQQAMAQMYANATTSALYQQQAAYDRYQFGMARPLGLGQLFAPSRPAIITRQDEERRLRAAYEQAIAEHDQQETDRLLRQLERHALLDAEERQAAELRRAQAQEMQQRIETAKARARELLFEHLTPEQRHTFDANGWFVVEGGKSKTKYRINTRGYAGNIQVLNGDRVTHRLCCHAQAHIPAGDQWLAQKVMLELAEDDFLRIANRHAA